MNNFSNSDLSAELLKSLEQLGYNTPTPVQRDTIPLMLAKNNIIVKSSTGTGKTAAFGIPIIESCEWIEKKPQALIIAPNRELVLQITNDLKLMGQYKRMKPLAIYGRDSIKAQQLALKQKNHIIVATPGRLMDLFERGCISLEELKYIVLDEADELLKPEFLKQLSSVLNSLSKDCAMALFSATITEEINTLTTLDKKDFLTVDTSLESKVNIVEQHFNVSSEDKNKLLSSHIKEFPKGGIIFVGTKHMAEKLYKTFRKKDISITYIHSDLEQRVRIRNMNGFKDGTFTYLIATDLSARGIDVDGIELVINYDLPNDPLNYTHRIGRIGRNGRKGYAISYICQEQKKLGTRIESLRGVPFVPEDTPCTNKASLVQAIPQNNKDTNLKPVRKVKGEGSGKDITRLYINGGKRKKLRAADMVGALCAINGLSHTDIGVIEIKENETYVEIMNHKHKLALTGLSENNIKGRKYKVHIARNEKGQ